MGPPFGASLYSLSFFLPLHLKQPVSDNGDLYPGASVLSDAFKGLGFSYLLMRGLQRTTNALKMIKDSQEGSGKNNSRRTKPITESDKKGVSRSLTVTNPVGIRPMESQKNVSYGIRKPSHGGEQLVDTRASQGNTSGFGREETIRDLSKGYSVNGSYGGGTTVADGSFTTERSLSHLLGFEGVVTTITGLSQQVQYKNDMKEIITVVKTADRVMEGVKAANGVFQTFSSPMSDVLLGLGAGNGVVLGVNTVKIVLKGVKISKGLVTVTKMCKSKQTGAIGATAEAAIKSNQTVLGQHFKVIVKGLKASDGAANVVRMTKDVAKTLGMVDRPHLFTWNLLMRGFKFTKNAIRVLEPLGSVHWGVVNAVGNEITRFKGAVDGIGVVVKACVLSKELYLVLIKGAGVTKGAMAAFNAFNQQRKARKNSQIPGELADVMQEDAGGEYSQRTRVKFTNMVFIEEHPLSLTVRCGDKPYFITSGWDSLALPLIPDLLKADVNSSFSRSYPSEYLETMLSSSPSSLTLSSCFYPSHSLDWKSKITLDSIRCFE